MDNNYTFANLQGHDEIIKEIVNLEEKIEEKLGKKVNIIAYTPEEELECRAGLND